MAQTKLNHVAMGKEDGPVVAFIHGFAGDHTGWANMQVGLSSSCYSIAFDLPGHGGSLSYPKTCNAAVAAKAVMDDLDALEVERVHLVGHSMGGATACLMALRNPQRVKSLTLIAPGGFGPEINQSLLRNYAKVTAAEQIHMLLEQFFGPEFDVPFALAERSADHRQREGALEALKATADAILDGKVQKTLPLDDLGALPMPIKVMWGVQDRVLPIRQSHNLPAMMGVHVFEKVGHMPHIEAGRRVLGLIRQNIRAGE